MAGTVNLVRSFIAIELPPEVLRVLEDLQARLGKGRDRAAKWVPVTGIHLTLKFLGDVTADRIPLVAAAMRTVAAAGCPLTLQLSGAGCFPSSERPRVLWAGLAGEVERLAQLQAGVQDAMAGLGFAREARGFTPHLTLARMRDLATPDELRRLGSAVKQLAVPRVDFTAGELALIRSDLLPSGAVYTVLATARLGIAQDSSCRNGHGVGGLPGTSG
jgi:RNA 2',3'-cyclic 3'-phosphodiesterase